MIQSFSVIVPVMNKEHAILRTLESVEASIQYFYEHYQGEHPVAAEIVVVNEGSSDRTPEIVNEFSRVHPHCKIVNHAKRTSAGTARNMGANAAKGDLLFFCDGDDLYYKEHIYLCYRMLSHDPANAKETSFVLKRDNGDQVINLPDQAVGVVRTAVHMEDEVHPYWKLAIENSVPQNVCVRRECHDFVEGFPEQRVPFNEVTCEDISYQLFLTKFFKLLKINLETVEYIRYPGNMFDRQLKKFQSAPDQYQEDMTPETRELHILRHKIEQEHIAYLFEKLKRLEKTPAFLSLMNWQQVGSDCMNQNNFQAAIPLFEYGLSVEPNNLNARSLLAAAYNNQGSAVRTMGDWRQATLYYQKALELNPAFSKTDLAKVNLNASATLRDQKQYEQALIYLQKALELEPNLPEAIAEVTKLKYYAHVAQRGYQFTQDWFSINIPVWQQQLVRFINIPDLKVLEIGSWEGRSTCWLLDNILTHPSARITCVDTFEGSVEHEVMCEEDAVKTIEQRFDANIAKTGASEKVRKMIGSSQTVLRSLIPNSYNLAYIDGSHVACDVLEDALLTWRLVKVGGVIIFDDYGFQFPEGITEDPPKVAVDAFMTVFGKKVRLLHQGYQVLVEKIAE
ncbi:MAG: class I SAM-dependent methyltransferase [Oscillatoriales cyanobacterium C42_A2020_001]|nr:class I SAM-dependent methyltransferase [Leptolyngbyaceae cyanobacterium C42_A2020_001]